MGVSHHDRRCVSRARAGGGDGKATLGPLHWLVTAAPRAASVAERASAASAAISAIRFCTAWNRDSGRPNWTRDVACSIESSSARSSAAHLNRPHQSRFQSELLDHPAAAGNPAHADRTRGRRRRCAAVHRSGSARGEVQRRGVDVGHVIGILGSPHHDDAVGACHPRNVCGDSAFVESAHRTNQTVVGGHSEGVEEPTGQQIMLRQRIRTPARTAADSNSAASYQPAPLPPEASSPVRRTSPRSSSACHSSTSRSATTVGGETPVLGEDGTIMSTTAWSTPVTVVVIASPIRARSHRASPRWCLPAG